MYATRNKYAEQIVPYAVASSVGSGADTLRSATCDGTPVVGFDALQTNSGGFITRLLAFYQDSGAAERFPLPRWALYDCGELPGAVVGFARTGDNTPQPVSMGVFIPMLEPGAWHVYALTADQPALIADTLHLGVELLHPCQLTTIERDDSGRERLIELECGGDAP